MQSDIERAAIRQAELGKEILRAAHLATPDRDEQLGGLIVAMTVLVERHVSTAL